MTTKSCPKCSLLMARCDFKYCPDCGAQLDSLSPSDAAACSVCEDVIQRLGGHKESRLDGETGLAAATMRSHEALLRVCDLLEAWKVTLKNRHGIIWDAMDAGDTQRLKMSIDDLKAAISPPNK